MRLLRARDFRLKSFMEEDAPPYAILSHLWKTDEVLYNDIQLDVPTYRNKQGFNKVSLACQQCMHDGLEYIWIDTLCIDKSSSAELSEAINSMFRWYRQAKICYAYLEDLDSPHDKNIEASLSVSEWFYRGWTLQELIAPYHVSFYDQKWHPLGTRDQLRTEIRNITGIDSRFLTSEEHVALDAHLQSTTVAQRMSWAARRRTTRSEDRAYSLLGIFGVNMPLLYGEGSRSFVRLQEEIIKINGDLSILAWQPNSSTPGSDLLAWDPNDFRNCQDIVSTTRDRYTFDHVGLSMTALGVQIQKPLISGPNEHYGEAFDVALSLGCRHKNNITEVIALKLKKITSGPSPVAYGQSGYSEPDQICQIDYESPLNPQYSQDRLVPTDFLTHQPLPEWPNLIITRKALRERATELEEGKDKWTHVWLRLSESFSNRWRPFRAHPNEAAWDLEKLTISLEDANKRRIQLGSDTQATYPITYIYEELIFGAVALSDNLDQGITIAFMVRDRYRARVHRSSCLVWKVVPYDADSFTNMAQDLELSSFQRSISLPLASARTVSATYRSLSRRDVFIALIEMDLTFRDTL